MLVAATLGLLRRKRCAVAHPQPAIVVGPVERRAVMWLCSLQVEIRFLLLD